MSDPPPITQTGATVVITGDALPLMYRATLALIARRRRDGLAASPLLQQAVTTLHRACMSSPRHLRDTTTPTPACCNGQDGADLISTAAAADLLGLSRRQAQRLAATGIGVRLGRSIWGLPRSAVLALKAEREATR